MLQSQRHVCPIRTGSARKQNLRLPSQGPDALGPWKDHGGLGSHILRSCGIDCGFQAASPKRYVRKTLFKRGRRELIAGALLVALAFRALVPVGFMPATDGSFGLQICHVGLSSALAAHLTGHHPSGGLRSDHCPFGAAPAGAPVPHMAPTMPRFEPVLERIACFAARAVKVRAERAHQPRGPPALI